MASWLVDVISPAMAERLADPAHGPLRRAGFADQITRLDRAVLQLDDMAVTGLMHIDYRDDGYVTYGDGDQLELHIGKDRRPLMRG